MNLDKWIAQVEADAEEDDFWMLFFKISRRGEYVVVNRNKGRFIGNVYYKESYLVMEKEKFFKLYKNKVWHWAVTKTNED